MPVPKCPLLTVDIVIVKDTKTVYIKRKNEPFKDCWALPGGFVDIGETVEHAAIREAKEETGLDIEIISLVGVYSDPNRDPRGHTVSIAYIAKAVGGEMKADDDAKEIGLFYSHDVDLAFDHKTIVHDAINAAIDMGNRDDE